MRTFITSMHKSCLARRIVSRRAMVPNNDARQVLKDAIQMATYLCRQEDTTEIECILAWDTVDEIGRGISKYEDVDPLEAYCAQHQDADECRVYDV